MCNHFKVILKIENLDDKSKNDFEEGFKKLITQLSQIKPNCFLV